MSQQELSGKAAYGRLLRYVKPYAWVFAITLLGFLVSAAMEGASAAFLGILTEVLDGKRGDEWHVYMPLIFLGIIFFRGLGNFLGNFSIQYVGRQVVRDLRADLFAKMLTLPSQFYAEQSAGRLLSRVTFEVDQISNLASAVFKTVVSEGLKALVLLGFLFYLNWKLTLIILIIGPLVGVVVSYASKRFRKLSKRIQNAMGEISKITQESISAQSEVKIYSAQDYEHERFSKANDYNAKQSLKLALTDSINTPLVQLLIALPLTLVIWLALKDYVGNLTTADFVSYFTAVGLIVKPIRALTSINSQIQKGLAASQSIFTLMDEASERDEGQQQLSAFKSAIRFEAVDFQYPGANQPVLQSIDLSIEKGKTVALVGRSGSGKSTLVSLVPRFIEPTQGQIFIDDQPLTHYSLSSLRSQIALVNQKITLFDGDVRSNIAYGELANASDEAIMKAAMRSHAKEFIEGLKDQYQSRVGHEGVQLSGGQRQRLAIARAMLKQAPILILDEATSALDSESETFIQSAIDELMGKTTMIVIAHRLSTIQRADTIVVMDQGQIIEQGSHEQLLAQNGLYTQLHQQQFGS